MTVKRIKPMVKTYVLVSENEYKSKAGGGMSLKRPLDNPFQNPEVKRAKRAREELYELTTDKSIPVDVAEDLITRALDKYRKTFANAVTGGRKQKSSLGGVDVFGFKRKKETRTPKREAGDVRGDDPEPEEEETPIIPTVVQRQNSPKRRDRAPLKGPFKNNEDVKGLLGGHWSMSDAAKASQLLNKMFEADLLTQNNFRTANEPEFAASPAALKNIVRDVITSDPDRRRSSADRIEQFSSFLRKKGVDYTIAPSETRVGGRPKKR